MRAFVRGLGELLITAGLLLLLFVGWQLWWTDVEANREQAGITEVLRESWGADPAGPLTTAPQGEAGKPPPDPPVSAPVAEGEAFAVLHVPAFGADYQRPVVEGTTVDVLKRGVGHYPGSAMPGEVGNVAIAGHRVTYGRPFYRIDELRPGDALVLEAADAWYIYRMRSYQIVTPDRVDVVAPVPGDEGAAPTERLLTLTSCHPRYSARQRYVVHAVLDRWQPKADGPPVELGEV